MSPLLWTACVNMHLLHSWTCLLLSFHGLFGKAAWVTADTILLQWMNNLESGTTFKCSGFLCRRCYTHIPSVHRLDQTGENVQEKMGGIQNQPDYKLLCSPRPKTSNIFSYHPWYVLFLRSRRNSYTWAMIIIYLQNRHCVRQFSRSGKYTNLGHLYPKAQFYVRSVIHILAILFCITSICPKKWCPSLMLPAVLFSQRSVFPSKKYVGLPVHRITQAIDVLWYVRHINKK